MKEEVAESRPKGEEEGQVLMSPWQHLSCTSDPFSLTNPRVGRENLDVWGLGRVRLEPGMCLLL